MRGSWESERAMPPDPPDERVDGRLSSEDDESGRVPVGMMLVRSTGFSAMGGIWWSSCGLMPWPNSSSLAGTCCSDDERRCDDRMRTSTQATLSTTQREEGDFPLPWLTNYCYL